MNITQKTKASILTVVIALLIISACTKSVPPQVHYMNNAVITGYDLRLCACCGGLLINFDSVTHSYQGPFYDCDNTPASLGIDSTTVFPVYLKVNWHLDSSVCGGNNHILITAYAAGW
jgi:hypothetical protein